MTCGQDYYIAEMTALWIQTILYGMFIIVFCRSMSILIYERPNKWLLTMSVVLFLSSTSGIITEFATMLLVPNILTLSDCTGGTCVPCPGASSPERDAENKIGSITSFFTYAFLLVGQISGDGLLIQRCYIIWQRKIWIVFLPIVLLLLTIVALVTQIGLGVTAYLMPDDVLDRLPDHYLYLVKMQENFTTIYLSASLATNIIVTSLIAWRIWSTSRELEKALRNRRWSKVRYATKLIVESGALITASLVLYLIVLYRAPDKIDIPFGILAQITGLAPTLIIVRAGSKCEPEYSLPTTVNRPEFARPMAQRSPFDSDSFTEISRSSLGLKSPA